MMRSYFQKKLKFSCSLKKIRIVQFLPKVSIFLKLQENFNFFGSNIPFNQIIEENRGKLIIGYSSIKRLYERDNYSLVTW